MAEVIVSNPGDKHRGRDAAVHNPALKAWECVATFLAAVDAAIQAEEDAVASLKEPESEVHPEEGDSGGSFAVLDPDVGDVQASLNALRQAVAIDMIPVAPDDASAGHEFQKVINSRTDTNVPQSQGGALDELMTLLLKLCRLTGLQGQSRRQLLTRLSAAEAEARLQRERASTEEAARRAAEAEAGQGEKAHALLESTLSRLTATRKLVKEREWELSEAKRRAETLEDERVRQDARMRALETALERASAVWAPAASQPDTDHHEAIERSPKVWTEPPSGQLRARVSAAELALDETRGELRAAEKRVQEVQERSAKRASELERQLQDATRRAEDLESRCLEAVAPRPPVMELPEVQQLQKELQDMQKECELQRSTLAMRMRELEEMCRARTQAELRARELEASVAAGQEREDLLMKQVAKRPVVPSLSPPPISKLDSSEPELYDISSARRAEAFESTPGSPNAAPKARAQARPPLVQVPALLNGESLASLGLVEQDMEEQHVPGVGLVQTPRRHRPAGAAAGRPPPKAGDAQQNRGLRRVESSDGSRAGSSQRSRPKASQQQGAKPMPMNLSALGNLLSGGGILGKSK